MKCNALCRWARISQLTMLSLVAVANADLHAATKVGNGGDAVYCNISALPGQQFVGYYSLDYLLTLGMRFGDDIQISSWTESANEIHALLARVSPSLAGSFAAYVDDIRNTSDYTRPHVWEPAPFGLIDLKDESIVTLVPDNCRDADRVRIVQAVVHQSADLSGRPRGFQLYSFVPVVLDELERTSPLQLSYLYVHEWLWKHSDNVSRNRRINRFLHSSDSYRHTPKRIKEQLTGMGLDMRDPGVLEEGVSPNHEHSTATMEKFTAPDSESIQSDLFRESHYCSGKIKDNRSRVDLSNNPSFKLYSRIVRTGSNSSYAPFGLRQSGKADQFILHNLAASVHSLGLGSASSLFQLRLDGGDVNFACTGNLDSRPPLSSSVVNCHAVSNDGAPYYWPNSRKPISFLGDLYPGCFVAKSEVESIFPDGKLFGQLMIIGHF